MNTSLTVSAITSTALAYLLYDYFSKESSRNTKKKENVVIIGASSGIGKQLSLKYAERGAGILLVARRANLLEELQTECKALTKSKVEIYSTDASVERNVELISAHAQKVLGGCDVLVLCMGVLSLSSFEELCQEKDRLESAMNGIFNVNLFGPIFCVKHFLEMLKKSSGRISVVSSVAGVYGAPTRTLYASTKFALNGFFDSLRIELKRFGISVTVVMPGTVDTDIRSSAVDKSDKPIVKASGISAEKCAQAIIDATDKRKRSEIIPKYYGWLLYVKLMAPDFIDRFAAKKYDYK